MYMYTFIDIYSFIFHVCTFSCRGITDVIHLWFLLFRHKLFIYQCIHTLSRNYFFMCMGFCLSFYLSLACLRNVSIKNIIFGHFLPVTMSHIGSTVIDLVSDSSSSISSNDSSDIHCWNFCLSDSGLLLHCGPFICPKGSSSSFLCSPPAETLCLHSHFRRFSPKCESSSSLSSDSDYCQSLSDDDENFWFPSSFKEQ